MKCEISVSTHIAQFQKEGLRDAAGYLTRRPILAVGLRVGGFPLFSS
jgi:hypothetical protein